MSDVATYWNALREDHRGDWLSRLQLGWDYALRSAAFSDLPAHHREVLACSYSIMLMVHADSGKHFSGGPNH